MAATTTPAVTTTAVPAVPATEPKFQVIKSRQLASRFVLGGDVHKKLNGMVIAFVEGVYMTKNAQIVEELMFLIEAGHETLYIDKADATRDATDPMEELKQRIIREYEAQKAAMDPDADRGNSVQTVLVPTNTRQMVANAAGSASPQ